MKLCGQLSGCIAVEVVCELLTRGLLWSSFFRSHRGRSGRTFFTLFRFIGIRLLSRLLVCRLYCSVGTVRSLLVLITIVAGNEHNQSEKYRRERNNFECGHGAAPLANPQENHNPPYPT